ncbi:MAG: hypothetical protein WDN49_13020 [Acetobacteraceae bacterium]
MWRETNLFGVYMSPLVAYMIATMLIFCRSAWSWPGCECCDGPGTRRWPETGIFLCILGALVTFL